MSKSPEPSPPDRNLVRRLGYWVMGMGSTLVLFGVIGLLLVVAVYLYSERANSELEQHEGIGQSLTTLDLEPLTGAANSVTLEDLKGKVVLIDFWGTWCPPCRAEIPNMAILDQELTGKAGFQFLAVSCGQGVSEDLEQLRTDTEAFLREQKLDLATYADPELKTRQAFAEIAKFRMYPSLYLLDRQGVIQGAWEGYSPGLVITVRERVRQLLEAPLENKPRRE